MAVRTSIADNIAALIALISGSVFILRIGLTNIGLDLKDS